MMDIKNYLQDFTKMVDVLKAHPKVRLLSFHAFEPASEADILDVEEHLGFALDEDLKTFFRQCNGLQLRWAHEDNPDWDRDELSDFVPGPFTYQDVLDDDGTIDGCVNILPIKEVFLTDWEERFGRFDSTPENVKVGDRELPYDEFTQQVKTFNLYHGSFSVAILVSQKDAQVALFGGLSHQYHVRSLRFAIAAYLEMLLKGKGFIPFAGSKVRKKGGLELPIVLEISEYSEYRGDRPMFSS